MDVIIMAGGKGTRMESDLPKCLVSVSGKPMIMHHLEYLRKFGCIDKIIIAANDRHEIHEFFSEINDDVILSIEKEPLGTGGAVNLALKHVDSEHVLILNSDDVADVDIDLISKFNGNYIIVSHPKLPFALIKEKHDGFIEYVEKPLLPEWVSIGWYLLKKSDLERFLKKTGSLEYDVLPKMKIKMFEHEGFWFPMNSKKQIAEFENSGRHL